MRHEITIPERCDPFARELYRLAKAGGHHMKHIAESAGLGANTVDNWRRKGSPKAADLEACFNAIGYRLVVVPIGDGKP